MARETPVVPFGRSPHVICEIKRSSPSRGEINSELQPATQAGRYVGAGITSISVLTEEDHFSGSLLDLMEIKRAFPYVSVLRKDFLLYPEDIDVSFRAGADAVLLIASIFDPPELREMISRTKSLGIDALVEVHDPEEVSMVRDIKPRLTGINSRDLHTFHVDLLHPVRLKAFIDWETTLVFESGIKGREEAAFAAAAGFDCLLVGEAVVRQPDLIDGIVTGLSTATAGDFWGRLYGRKREGRPLVKICGLTNKADVDLAIENGADMLGFIFADSPRKTNGSFVKSLGIPAAGDPPRVAVVVADSGRLLTEIPDLLRHGYLDAVQFHGDEGPDECFSLAHPYYKALRIGDPAGVEAIRSYRCPRVLLDAFAPGLQGGTGKRLSASAIEAATAIQPVWLAGGINPDNVEEIVTNYGPELIDLASGVELSPGKKDPEKVRRLFGRIAAGG